MFSRFDMIYERDRHTRAHAHTYTPHDCIGRASRGNNGPLLCGFNVGIKKG